MDEFSIKLATTQNGKFSYLRLLQVAYDEKQNLCELTFLYPESVAQIDAQTRAEVQKFASENLKIHAAVKVKFKKSFLDERLLKNQIIGFFKQNYKSISSQLSEKQIEVFKENDNIKIVLHMCKEVQQMFDNTFAKKQLLGELEDNFIANFDIQVVQDETFKIASKIPDVPIKVPPKRVVRYQVEPIKKLFGKDISPNPELIKNNTAPKSDVILFGKISNVQKKTFTAKSGKRKGEEKTYYTFNLNDGSQIECVYFCTKSNEKKCEALADGMPFLCLGNLKMGLTDKLTYYISAMTYAQLKTQPQEEEPEQEIERAGVVPIEDYFEHKQENIFVKEPVYKEPVSSRNIVVYDLETTGLDPETCDIIEIGAIKIEKGRITKKFATFVNPGKHIPDEASAINHITDDMVAGSPKIEDVIVDFYKFCEGCIISGYNNNNFDNNFLKKAYQKAGLKFNVESLDVMLLARGGRIKTTNFKLTTVAAALGIELSNAHRAYNDAFATAKVLLKLNEIS